MIDISIKIAFNLLNYWILMLTMQYVCAAHMELGRRNAAIGSALSVLGTVIAVICPVSLEFIVSMAVVILLSVCLFSRSRPSDLLRFFPAFCIYFFLVAVPTALVEEIVGPSNIQPADRDGFRMLISYAPDVTLLVLLLILRHVQVKYRTRVYFSAREILGSIALLFFSFIDGAFILILNRTQYAQKMYWLFIFIFVGGYLLGVGYFVYCLIESRVRIYRQTVASCETEYLRVQLDSLQEAKENEDEVRKLRHDLKNHLAVLTSLCEAGDYEEVKRYTEQLGHEALRNDSVIPTGNQIADMVIASKRKFCRSHGIGFEFSGALNKLNALTAPDICGLLANAYDNAIEACLGQTQGYIRTRVNPTRNYTVIEIVNSVEGKVPVRGNSVTTTKKDKKAHGYGIKIMTQIARRYNGNCEICCDGKEFQLKLVLLT